MMQIAIDVNDESVAKKILDYLKNFRQEITVETISSQSSSTYLDSQQFIKDKISLETTLENIQNQKTKLTEVDDDFWNDMEKVITSA